MCGISFDSISIGGLREQGVGVGTCDCGANGWELVGVCFVCFTFIRNGNQIHSVVVTHGISDTEQLRAGFCFFWPDVSPSLDRAANTMAYWKSFKQPHRRIRDFYRFNPGSTYSQWYTWMKLRLPVRDQQRKSRMFRTQAYLQSLFPLLSFMDKWIINKHVKVKSNERFRYWEFKLFFIFNL